MRLILKRAHYKCPAATQQQQQQKKKTTISRLQQQQQQIDIPNVYNHFVQ